MINKTKKGFSLAEILIALGIVSIIATMGFSISKKGIERAYNLYYYTGYSGLQTALSEAKYKVSEDKDDDNVADADKVKIGNDKWKEYIAEIFKGQYNEGNNTITAPNNISYKIDNKDDRFLFEMTIPGSNGVKKVNLYYAPENYDFLILDSNFYNRIDLLPFYIDDGIKGRIRNVYDSNTKTFDTKYEARQYISFFDAFCNVDVEFKYDDESIITCSNPNPNPTPSGMIKIANPQKVF